MALGGHVTTYLGSPEGTLIYTAFAQKCQKRSKRGYPCFLPIFGKVSGTKAPPAPNGLSDGIFEHLLPFPMLENITFGHFFEVRGPIRR